VAFVSAGTCTIDADIASDGTYVGADAVDISFTVTLASRTHQIDASSYDASYELVDTPPTITSTPSAGAGTKSYSSSTTSVCTINSSSGVVAFVSAGTCTIGSSIASDGTYNTANASDISFLVGLAARTLTIDVASYEATYELADAPPTITSTASAGAGTKSYTSLTPGVCTINSSSGVVTFVATGTCTIDADIASDGTYGAADALDISFTVTSGGSGEEPGGPVMASPTGASVVINAGDACSPSRNVTLTLSASNVTEVLVSNNALLTGSSWTSFSSPEQMTWTLTAGDGPKTVYVLYRNGALTSSIASDTIELDVTDECGEDDSSSDSSSSTPSSEDDDQTEDSGDSNDSQEEPTNDESEEETAESDGAPDFSGISYDVYIVNPDGTQRHMSDLYYVRTRAVGEGVDMVRFEDKGSDFDYDDVIVRVDRTNWNRMLLTAVSVDAGWRHNVRVAFYNRGALVGNVLVWADSHLGVGQYAIIDADAEGAFRGLGPVMDPLALNATSYLNPDGLLPPMAQALVEAPYADGPMCELTCEQVAYDLYIINPDGTERHTGSSYVRTTEMAPGEVLYAFEDSGKDFDYNDVEILMDASDCQNIAMTMTSLSAGWHHRVALAVAYGGVRRFETLVWMDTHAAIGGTTQVALNSRLEMCVEPVEETPMAASEESSCVLEQPIARQISPGESGDQVRDVQRVLQCLGYFPEDEDPTGFYGQVTIGAVRAFQEANGLVPTTGGIGPRTTALLNGLTP